MCSLYGFNICGVRPVFSIDACSFFPQCVLVIILLTGDVQMQQLVPSPGVLRGSGSSGMPPEYMMGAEVSPDHSWSLQGQRQKLTTSHCWQAAAVAHNHPWGLCRQCPAICEHVQREKATVQVLPLPNASLKQWQLATKATLVSFSYTLSCSHTGFQPP